MGRLKLVLWASCAVLEETMLDSNTKIADPSRRWGMSNRLSQIGQGIAGASSMGVGFLTPFLRRHRTTWGATPREIAGELPGDGLMSDPKWQFTQAISIDAPTEKVWPWLAQIGQGRGGFYSYETLENLVGCDIHNADRVSPEYQGLRPGDSVKLHPKVAMPVAAVEPGKAIVLDYDSRTGYAKDSPTRQKDYFQSTWLFCVQPKDDGSSRLIARFRIGYNRSLRNKIAYRYFMEPISTTMQRQMLRGIKNRVEAA